MSSTIKAHAEAANGSAPGERGASPRAQTAASLHMGGMALKNGLVLLSERHWAAAIRENDGGISVASGRKPRLVTSGDNSRAEGGSRGRSEAPPAGTSGGVPLLRGLGRFGEGLLLLALVKLRLPQAELPLEGGRVAGALAGSIVATSAVKAFAPKSALMQETGGALAAFVPAVLALRNSPISGYHGAEHKVIGSRESASASGMAWQAGTSAAWIDSSISGGALSGSAISDLPDADSTVADRPILERTRMSVLGGEVRANAATGAQAGTRARTGSSASTSAASFAPSEARSAAASKEHDRCGSNLVGPFLLATVATNLIARGRSGRKSPAASAIAGAVSLGVALEALRWATTNSDSVLSRLLLLPGRAIQKHLTTREPSADQLEVGQRALAELLRLENVSV
jgi:hypothetical protein